MNRTVIRGHKRLTAAHQWGSINNKKCVAFNLIKSEKVVFFTERRSNKKKSESHNYQSDDITAGITKT